MPRRAKTREFVILFINHLFCHDFQGPRGRLGVLRMLSVQVTIIMCCACQRAESELSLARSRKAIIFMSSSDSPIAHFAASHFEIFHSLPIQASSFVRFHRIELQYESSCLCDPRSSFISPVAILVLENEFYVVAATLLAVPR